MIALLRHHDVVRSQNFFRPEDRPDNVGCQ